MELLKGGDLVPYTKPANLLPVDKVVSIVARVADALGYAHKQNVVHRDIKPANMMYDAGDRHAEGHRLRHRAPHRLARRPRPAWCSARRPTCRPSSSPARRSRAARICSRSAVSLYQLLCGKLPFEGDSMAQLMFKIANEPPTDILSVNPNLPPGLVAFLDKALAKNADERYQTGEEFAARAARGARAVRRASSRRPRRAAWTSRL